jgi:hypothetical protein
MRGKLFSILLATAVVFVAGASVAKAASVDSSRDCDKYAIVYCGTMSPSEAREKYSNGDNNKVFASFGISKSEITNDMKDGIVYQDGRVVVAGKTVATNAKMAARHLGGTPISGTTAAKLSVSNMGSAQTAMVKFDANGEFVFAIMKPCGNPVIATPKPQPKPAAICKALTATPVSRTQYKLTASSSVSNGATVSAYTFTVKNSAGTVVDTKVVSSTSSSAAYTTTQETPGKYSASVAVTTSEGIKTGPSCAASFTVPPIPTQPAYTCDSLTVTKHSSTDYSFKTTYTLKDATLKAITYVVTDKDGKEVSRSTNSSYTQTTPGTYSVQALLTVTVNNTDKIVTSEACKAALVITTEKTPNCPIPGKEHLPESSPECEETPPVTPPETPEELPETGLLGNLSSIFGLGALITSGGYYIASRRHVNLK